jgi:hypothetical protein
MKMTFLNRPRSASYPGRFVIGRLDKRLHGFSWGPFSGVAPEYEIHHAARVTVLNRAKA